MFFHNALSLVGRHLDVGDLFLAALVDLNDRFILANADAAGLGNGSGFGKTHGVYFFHKCVEHRSCTGGNAAGRHADNDADVVGTFTKGNLILHAVADFSKFC